MLTGDPRKISDPTVPSNANVSCSTSVALEPIGEHLPIVTSRRLSSGRTEVSGNTRPGRDGLREGTNTLSTRLDGQAVCVPRARSALDAAVEGDCDQAAAVEVPRAEKRGLVWVGPEQLVAEVDYRGWTTDKFLRHASFKGLREDKDAAEVVLEG